MNAQVKFPSPYELKAPKGAEGWRDLYPYYALFQDELKKGDEKQFWFCDAQHWPTPFRPFDTIMVDFAVKCLGQYNTRHLARAAGQWRRLPHTQWLPLSEPDRGRAREDSRARAAFSGTRGLLFPELEQAAGQLARQGARRHRCAGGVPV